jgi:hypothetical protein
MPEETGMATLLTEPRLKSPDDIYEALLSLADGLDDGAARAALAAFALLLANHIGEDAVILDAVTRVKQAFREFPEGTLVGASDPAGKTYQLGGALASLRKVIELKPVSNLPGALTS